MNKTQLINRISSLVEKGYFNKVFPFTEGMRFSGAEGGEKWWCEGGNPQLDFEFRFFRIMSNEFPKLTLEFCTHDCFEEFTNSEGKTIKPDISWYDVNDCDCKTLSLIINIAKRL